MLALAVAPWRAIAAGTRVSTGVETEAGAFVIEVDTAVAPVTVANHFAYVDGHLLEGASVYRVVTLANQTPETAHRIEVLHWGMNLPDGHAPPFPSIAHETTRGTGLKHLDGTVSMASAAPGSAASEFFMCVGDQSELDFGGRRNPDGQGFAVFGRVVSGQDVVQAMHAWGEAQQYLARPVVIRSVRRVAAEYGGRARCSRRFRV